MAKQKRKSDSKQKRKKEGRKAEVAEEKQTTSPEENESVSKTVKNSDWSLDSFNPENIQAVFFDVDGTLLMHPQEIIPKSALDSIQALQKKGIKVLIATGRSPVELDNLPLEGMEPDGWILLNGQYGYDKQGVFTDKPLNQQEVQIIRELYESRICPVIAVEKDDQTINCLSDMVKEACEVVNCPVPNQGPFPSNDIYMAVAYLENEESARVFQNLQGFEITFWNEFGIDVFPEHSGKESAIAAWLEKYGLERGQIIAFGDGDNDFGMIELAGVGIAMGNSDDKLKEAADYVTDPIDQDGILHALQALKLVD